VLVYENVELFELLETGLLASEAIVGFATVAEDEALVRPLVDEETGKLLANSEDADVLAVDAADESDGTATEDDELPAADATREELETADELKLAAKVDAEAGTEPLAVAEGALEVSKADELDWPLYLSATVEELPPRV